MRRLLSILLLAGSLFGQVNKIDLTRQVKGILPLPNGGCGQATATACLNALLPAQSGGTNGLALISNGAQALWGTVASPVQSVAGKTGVVTLVEADIANLSSDLASKALDSAVMHIGGTEVVTGGKTFSATTNFSADINVAGNINQTGVGPTIWAGNSQPGTTITVPGGKTFGVFVGSDNQFHCQLSGGSSCLSATSALGDPGANGIVKRISLNTSAVAVAADIAVLWNSGTCGTNYMKGDGSCGTGGATYNQLIAPDNNTLEQRFSTGAQTQVYKLYGHYTDASNGDWLEIGSNYIRTVKNGSGTAPGWYLGTAGVNKVLIATTGFLEPVNDGTQDLGLNTLGWQNLWLEGFHANTFANDSSTGTTLNKLAKINGTGPSTVVKALTTDVAVLGIVVGGAGTTGNASIALSGVASCVFDGATTANDFVIISPTVAGDCNDAGAPRPIGKQILGQVQTTNGAGGTYPVTLFGPDDQGQLQADWNAVSGVQQILNKPTLATVATSGAYADLTGKPTIPALSNSNPVMDGAAAAGSATTASRSDHVHPSDTSRQPLIGTTGLLVGSGGGIIGTATYTTITGLWSSCTGTTYLRADANCLAKSFSYSSGTVTTSISTVGVCTTTQCPAGTYLVTVFLNEMGTGCTTVGGGLVTPNISFLDPNTSHIAASIRGTNGNNGTSAVAMTLTVTGTAFYQGSYVLVSNGPVGGSDAIQFATTVIACTTPGSWTGYQARVTVVPWV